MRKLGWSGRAAQGVNTLAAASRALHPIDSETHTRRGFQRAFPKLRLAEAQSTTLRARDCATGEAPTILWHQLTRCKRSVHTSSGLSQLERRSPYFGIYWRRRWRCRRPEPTMRLGRPGVPGLLGNLHPTALMVSAQGSSSRPSQGRASSLVSASG